MKVQISSIEKMANIQVIELNASFVAGAIEAALTVESIVADGKSRKRKYNDAKGEWENVLDDNGNQVFSYEKVSVQELEQHLLPFLEELHHALLEG